MNFRSILGGALAMLLLDGAASADATRRSARVDPSRRRYRSGQGTAGSSARGRSRQWLLMAQAADPRVVALEEQIRALNGTIEELNFQMLQMQEQIRKMQEDNEFRFQELEGKKSDASTGQIRRGPVPTADCRDRRMTPFYAPRPRGSS